MASSNFDKKRLKLSENEVVVDRISSLPDQVLCLILSFLQTQQSVQTCILSKRWRFLWINVHNLNFNCSSAPPLTDSLTCFEKLVTMAMLLHKSQSLNRLSFNWRHGANPFIVTASLSTAISRNVRKLRLSIYCLNNECVELPSSLFTCKSLVILTLTGDFLVDVPVFVSLPNLLYINLDSVMYKCYKCAKTVQLIKGCPVLRTLIVSRSRYDNVGVFRISSPTLKYLSIVASSAIKYSLPKKNSPEYVVPKLEINAPALEYLHIADSLSKDFTFQSLSSSVQEISGATAHSSENFKSLTILILNVRFLKWDLLIRLLENSVHLQVLRLEEPSYLSGSHEMWKDGTPRFLCSSLRRISISKFKDTEDVIEMIKYFLQNGEVLERVELYPCTAIALSETYNLLKKVSAIRRKSRACEVHVLD